MGFSKLDGGMPVRGAPPRSACFGKKGQDFAENQRGGRASRRAQVRAAGVLGESGALCRFMIQFPAEQDDSVQCADLREQPGRHDHHQAGQMPGKKVQNAHITGPYFQKYAKLAVTKAGRSITSRKNPSRSGKVQRFFVLGNMTRYCEQFSGFQAKRKPLRGGRVIFPEQGKRLTSPGGGSGFGWRPFHPRRSPYCHR